MPAESTARPKRSGRGSETATVLPFPRRVAVALDPAYALDRIVSSLTGEQAQALAPEIEILTGALSAETIPSRPVSDPKGYGHATPEAAGPSAAADVTASRPGRRPSTQRLRSARSAKRSPRSRRRSPGGARSSGSLTADNCAHPRG
jgi:hypothetical protein